jgi:hypothetical protein
MLERMVGRQYRFPPDAAISAECIDLLQQMLLPEPHRRITIEGIMAHPWFNTNLPPEASSMNATYLSAAAPVGVLAPEAICKLIEEARLPSNSCKVDPSLSPQQQAAVVMQLVAEEQQQQQNACSMPYEYQQQPHTAVPMQCQQQQPEAIHARAAAAPAAAYQQQQPAPGAALPHLLQQQQVMLLQRLQEQQWQQQQGQAQQQPGLADKHERGADVDDEVRRYKATLHFDPKPCRLSLTCLAWLQGWYASHIQSDLCASFSMAEHCVLSQWSGVHAYHAVPVSSQWCCMLSHARQCACSCLCGTV